MSIEKQFITANSLLSDSFRLAYQILESDFRPKFIAGVWRGGAPIGIAVQELLEHHGVDADHIAIRTSSYIGMEQQKTVRVHGLEYIIENINAQDSLLLVDDVFDSGRSLSAIVEKLHARCRRNMPEVVKIATVYYKPLRNVSALKPDYFVHETDAWLVFPHELQGLTDEELEDGKGINLEELRRTRGPF